MEPYIRMVGITKKFPGVVANDSVNFEVYKGEIHALLGENGAGKTTLMRVLYGLYRPDAGKIYVNGNEVKIGSPTEALRLGIGMVHQHFSLIPYFTVAENVAIGLGSWRNGLEIEKIKAMIKDVSEDLGLYVNPDAYVHQLSVGERQRVEIIKMLVRGVNVLILDEPTSALTPQESQQLFNVLKRMKDGGRGVVLITHKMYEVMEVADRVTVLRRGRVVLNALKGEISEKALVEAMVGKEVILGSPEKRSVPQKGALSVEGLVVKGDRGEVAVNGISFVVRGGEIVGIAGVAGNGQRELVEAIFGMRKAVSGKITVDGVDITNKDIRDRVSAGLELIPEDRLGTAVIPKLSLFQNAILHERWWDPYSKMGVLSISKARDLAKRIINSFGVATPNEQVQAGSLSGGNIQKFVVGRSMARGARYLIAVNPTAGLDVAATDSVRKTLVEFRNSGGAVLLVSEDLDELLSLSDRLYVIYRGKLVKEFLPQFDRLAIGEAMMGGQQ